MSDHNYFAARLEDPGLLLNAVDVDGLLAVPVGGKRRGGFVNVEDQATALKALTELALHPGFPKARYVAGDDEVADAIAWGEEPPPVPSETASDDEWLDFDEETGRFYGYSESAIAAFMERDG
jgi:hypothetical protein